MSTWTPVSTNVLDGSGDVSITNLIDKTQRQRYYRIQMP